MIITRHVNNYDANGLARVYEDTKWYLINQSGEQVGDTFTYIEEWEEGYYKVEQGIKKNILRPDGTLVLKQWHNDVYQIKNGYFIFSNTIRKSKTNPKTRYTYGIARVNGDVIFPMVFDLARWTGDEKAIYVEIGEKPYFVTLDGSLFDPAGDHLPKKISIDYKDIFEKFANWTLPGLQFFYRDTDAPVIVNTTYHVGDVLRAGFFIDATTKLQKPAHKTRFLIASAHCAMMCELDELVQQNPNVKNWNLCVFHYNSYFKVMDVYERDGITQVFLLHIPRAAAYFLGNDETAINFMNEATGQGATLVEMARKSFDEKMQMEVHPRSLDKEFVERMHHPIGLDNEFYPVDMSNQEEPEGEAAGLSNIIHKLANDEDLKDFFKVEDNFPYRGVDKSICKGCVYANGIRGNGEGCGRLFMKSFRNRYLKGECEFKKTDLFEPSEFERKSIEDKRLAKETAEKQCDTFALNMVKSFINERLNGDIKGLKYFNFDTLKEDTTYGNGSGNGLSLVYGIESMLMKSILTLVFADAWPDFTYESMDKHKFKADTINITNTIFGIGVNYKFSTMDKYELPSELVQRIENYARKVSTIGNTMVLPFGLHLNRDTKPFGRGYTDFFLQEFYNMMIGAKKCNMQMLEALKIKKKEVAIFRTEQQFKKITQELMLEDFLDETGKPKHVFQGVMSWEKGYERETYIQAIIEYLDFCEPFIDKRADRIIEKLEKILKNN